MFKIKYEHTIASKKYFNYRLVYIIPTYSVNMVLKQACAHSLKLTYITPTPNISVDSKCRKNSHILKVIVILYILYAIYI